MSTSYLFDVVPAGDSRWASALRRATEITTSSPRLSSMFDQWMPAQLLALLFYTRAEAAGSVGAVDLTAIKDLVEQTREQDPLALRADLAKALHAAGHDPATTAWGEDPVADVWRNMGSGPVQQLPAFQELPAFDAYPTGSTALGRTLDQLRELFATIPADQQ